MRGRPWLWALLAPLGTSACALVGYDFDQYRADSPDATATTFSSLGGAPEEPVAGGQGGAGGAAGGAGECQPRGCLTLPASCGVFDDGCGASLDCGECFWWFEECRQHVCQIIE